MIVVTDKTFMRLHGGLCRCIMKIMEVLRLKPIAFYRMDDTSPFQDYSGYNRSATITGTESHGISLTTDSAYSQRFSTTNYASFTAPVYAIGTEGQSFSISATAFPIIDGAPLEQRIVSHGGSYDGITITGTVVNFTTLYNGAGSARCSYDLITPRKVDIVGVHTSAKNSLYIDGILVSEIDITSAQSAVPFDITDQLFYCGYASTSNQKVLVNNVGFFPRSLQPEEIYSMYLTNNIRGGQFTSNMFGGTDIYVSKGIRNPFLNVSWSSDDEWRRANTYNVSVDGDAVYAQVQSGLTLSGTWTSPVDLYTGPSPLPIESINISWVGENITVETSTDNINWTAATNGSNLSNIASGFDPSDKALYVRVNFTSGLSEAYIEELVINGYNSATALFSNRVITYPSQSVAKEERDPLELQEDWGVTLGGGTITIAPDAISGSPEAVKSIELWVKKSTSTYPTLSANFASATSTYVNGVAGAITYNAGEWVVLHYTLAAGFSGDITIAGDIQLGKVTVYPSTLSASTITSLVTNYTGVNNSVQTGSSSIAIAESATPVSAYAYDWEIVAA